MNHDRDTDTHDIDWVTAQQPERSGSDPFVSGDPFARERALQALVRHMDRGSGRRFGLRRLFGVRTLGFAAAGAAAALLAIVLLSSGGGGADSTGSLPAGTAAVAPGEGSSGPLMKLADYVGESPEPTGNATLVQRTRIEGGEPETSYEVYGDEGAYLWSPTKQGIVGMIEGRPDAVAAGEIGDNGIAARELAAAEEANTGDVQAAAEDMAAATGHPSERFSAADKLYPNRVWEWSQQAIIAGAGRPEIRAGVLKMLDTLPGMTIVEDVQDGVPTLVLTSGPAETGSGYTEKLTIDARTGEPIKFVGGPTGGTLPSTTVEYEVSREQYAGLPSAADTTE